MLRWPLAGGGVESNFRACLLALGVASGESVAAIAGKTPECPLGLMCRPGSPNRTSADGVYSRAIENSPFTRRRDHPSMLGALGILPEVGLIDRGIMLNTLKDVEARLAMARYLGLGLSDDGHDRRTARSARQGNRLSAARHAEKWLHDQRPLPPGDRLPYLFAGQWRLAGCRGDDGAAAGMDRRKTLPVFRRMARGPCVTKVWSKCLERQLLFASTNFPILLFGTRFTPPTPRLAMMNYPLFYSLFCNGCVHQPHNSARPCGGGFVSHAGLCQRRSTAPALSSRGRPLLAGSQTASEEKPLKVVLIAGNKDHKAGEHDYPNWQNVWQRMLEQHAATEVDKAWEFPGQKQIDWADVLVFYHRGRWNDERAAAIDPFLARGGGAVYIHWAVDGRGGEHEMAKRIGLASLGGSIGYRHGRCISISAIILITQFHGI